MRTSGWNFGFEVMKRYHGSDYEYDKDCPIWSLIQIGQSLQYLFPVFYTSMSPGSITD